MAVKIGHASIDENGRIVGGKVGDQTGKEICIREWYKKPWNVMLICTDEKIADKAADYMETICKNDNYGYDQGQRTTGYTSIKKNGVAKGKGEFDCSSLIASCYNLAGLDVNVNCTTRNLRKALLATGKFKAYENAAHIKTSDYALLRETASWIFRMQSRRSCRLTKGGSHGKERINQERIREN